MTNNYQKTVLVFVLLAGALAAILFIKPKSAIAPHPPAPIVQESDTTTIFFAGDIMLSRNVARKIYTANDFTLPFIKVAELIKSEDISFANLESPFFDQGNHFVEGSLIFNADPKSIEGLKLAGFDVLSTANNHSLDQGIQGLNFTNQLLSDQGILAIGTFPNNKADLDPTQNVIKRNDILFGFLAYSYSGLNDGGKTISPNVADFNNLEKLKQDILGMRGHSSDLVIVSMHAGTEYTREPAQQQIAFAHAAIDAGADLVIGHHPHWIQTIEQYKGKWIFYSLGNFVFDQMWSPDTKEGLTIFATYKNSELTKIELKPVIIEDYCCPRWATSDESRVILEKIGLTEPILMNKN